MQYESARFIVNRTLTRADESARAGQLFTEAFPELASPAILEASDELMRGILARINRAPGIQQFTDHIVSAMAVAMAAGYGYGMADSATMLSETSDPDTWNLEGE